ncbi:hypothetical protein Tco_0691602 [Tanacetum coccineum]
MDNPNITMEEYIRLEEEKAHRRAIVFNDTLTSEAVLSCEPTVSSLNNDEIDFRISFDESDDEDCTSSGQAIDNSNNTSNNNKASVQSRYVEATSDSSAPVTHDVQSPPQETGSPGISEVWPWIWLMGEFDMVTAQQAALVAQLRARFANERSRIMQKDEEILLPKEHNSWPDAQD